MKSSSSLAVPARDQRSEKKLLRELLRPHRGLLQSLVFIDDIQFMEVILLKASFPFPFQFKNLISLMNSLFCITLD